MAYPLHRLAIVGLDVHMFENCDLEVLNEAAGCSEDCSRIGSGGWCPTRVLVRKFFASLGPPRVQAPTTLPRIQLS